MSFVNEVEGEVAGASPGGGLHADQGVFGAGLHAASALAHNALDAGHDLTGGLSRAGGHLMGGLGHGASDLLHGDLRGAIGDVSGGVRGAGGDLAQAQLDAMGHLGIPPGAIPAAQAGFGVFQGARTAWSSYQGNAPPGQTRVEGMATGVGGINSALGFGRSNMPAEHMDDTDRALANTQTTLDTARRVIGAPAQVVDLAAQAQAGRVPGLGMMERLSGGAIRESEVASRLSRVLTPVAGFIENQGTRILQSPVGSLIERGGAALTGGAALAGGSAARLAGRLIPGINIAAAGISALQSGRDTVDRYNRGDYLGAAVEGLHTATNALGVIPGAGALISAGGDLVAGSAHWLAEGGARQIGDAVGGAAGMVGGAARAVSGAVGNAASAVGGAVGGAASAVGGAVGSAVSGTAEMAGRVASSVNRAVGGAASAVGGAVGNAASAVGGAVGNAASAVGGAVGHAASAVGGAVGGAASAVGGAVGGAASAVGGAVGGAARRVFSGW